MASKQEEEEEGSDEQAQSENHDPASRKKFFIVLTGRTNGAHQSVVRIFKSLGQKEAEFFQDADYCLVFCPVTSRVGTDVAEAMEHLPADKGAVLVVMHHTFNPDQVIPPSRRLVKDQRIRLTLDCLFYKDKLLKCQFNKNMDSAIRTFFPSFKSKTSWRSPRESHQTSSDGTSNEKKSEDVAGPGPSKNTTSSHEAGGGAEEQSLLEDDPSKMIQNTETSATDRTEETREDEHQKTNQRDQKTKTSGEPSDGPDPPDRRRESESREQRTTHPQSGDRNKDSNQEQASPLDGPSGGNQSMQTSFKGKDLTSPTINSKQALYELKEEDARSDTPRSSGGKEESVDEPTPTSPQSEHDTNSNTNMDEPRQMLQNTETSATDGNEGDQKE